MDELSPIFRALADHPLPFIGGFCSGLFRLSANEDPVKQWLVEQFAKGSQSVTSYDRPSSNGKGPQAIAID
jgi:hypothetical protein